MDWTQLQLNRLTKGALNAPVTPLVESSKVLLVSAHPLEDSLSGSLAGIVEDELTANGHAVTRINLYNIHGSPFQPSLTPTERRGYFNDGYPTPSEDVKPFIASLQDANKLVFVYPTWWFSTPAILKGFIDRVFLPGVAFRLPHLESKEEESYFGLIPGLTNIKKVGVVTTYGAPRHIAFVSGDCGRNFW